MLIPDEFTEAEKRSGMWWRQLVAGGGAGVGKTLHRLEMFSMPIILNYMILVFYLWLCSQIH